MSSACDDLTGICKVTVTASAEYIGTNLFTFSAAIDSKPGYPSVADSIIVKDFKVIVASCLDSTD
jgi:hypothetical protein